MSPVLMDPDNNKQSSSHRDISTNDVGGNSRFEPRTIGENNLSSNTCAYTNNKGSSLELKVNLNTPNGYPDTISRDNSELVVVKEFNTINRSTIGHAQLTRDYGSKDYDSKSGTNKQLTTRIIDRHDRSGPGSNSSKSARIVTQLLDLKTSGECIDYSNGAVSGKHTVHFSEDTLDKQTNGQDTVGSYKLKDNIRNDGLIQVKNIPGITVESVDDDILQRGDLIQSKSQSVQDCYGSDNNSDDTPQTKRDRNLLAWKSTFLKLQEIKQYDSITGKNTGENITGKTNRHHMDNREDDDLRPRSSRHLGRRKLLRAHSAVGFKNIIANDSNASRMGVKPRPKTAHVISKRNTVTYCWGDRSQSVTSLCISQSSRTSARQKPNLGLKLKSNDRGIYMSNTSLLTDPDVKTSLLKRGISSSISSRSARNSDKNIENEYDFTPDQELRMRDILNTWYKYGVMDKDGDSSGSRKTFMKRDPTSHWSVIRGKQKTAAEILKEKRIKARQRFLWAYRLVSMVLYYQREMISISNGVTVWSAVESQWYALHVSKEAKKLVFNKNNFAQNKTLMKMPRWARAILDKEPSDRTDDDCRKLHAMLRGLKSYDKFTEKIQLAMCKAFIYYRVAPMRIVLRQGHIGHNFYFIYSGSVFVNLGDVNDKGQRFSRTEAILTKGDSFGEIALLKEVPRSASVTSREDCELLVVEKEIFSKVCPKIFDMELEEKYKFIRKVPLFHPKYWTEEAIQSICFEALIQEYKTGKVISPSSANDQWLYICMEDSCRVVKCLASNETNSTQHNDCRKQLGCHDNPLSIEDIEKEKQKKREQRQVMEDKHNNNNSQIQGTHNDTIKQMKSVLTDELEEIKTSARTRRMRKLSLFNRSPMTSTPRTSANLQSKRDRMLDSMKVEYSVNPLFPGQLMNIAEKGAEEMTERFSQMVQHRVYNGVITFTSLINQNREMYKGSCDLIYIDIGSIEKGDIFDLAELLAPSDTQTKSCLILVSAGCKVFRVKKDTVLSKMTHQSTDHAKYLARNTLYPSNVVLAQSVREKQEWDSYKTDVLQETVKPYESLKRHSHAVDIMNNKNRSQSARVIKSLRADKQDARDHALEEVINENALADRDDIEGEFESRMLNEASGINEKLVINPIMPGGQRRTSVYGGKHMIITPNSARYDGGEDTIYEEDQM